MSDPLLQLESRTGFFAALFFAHDDGLGALGGRFRTRAANRPLFTLFSPSPLLPLTGRLSGDMFPAGS